jgi:hypothetical protein
MGLHTTSMIPVSWIIGKASLAYTWLVVVMLEYTMESWLLWACWKGTIEMKEYNVMKATVSALYEMLVKISAKNADTIALYNMYQKSYIAFHGTKDHAMYSRMVKLGW